MSTKRMCQFVDNEYISKSTTGWFKKHTKQGKHQAEAQKTTTTSVIRRKRCLVLIHAMSHGVASPCTAVWVIVSVLAELCI